ncbi:MAG: Rrf2 family transcriptional regulator [Weeksellaceae bacterium]|jgi:Rrf2 family protein|nr:Rrf2 family transcriptional regulator [Weeksellaceae bacterium]MDX9704646.1 Rrf2 family transcriptional regulator [Weeksellaceae bacterium]
MFSKTCEYAIRAIIYIAQQTQDGSKISVKAIAKGIDSPQYFIAKILQDLGKKGLVQSLKGPTGGFYLSAANLAMPIADIVKEIDGIHLFTSCALGLSECSEEHPCPLHDKFKDIKRDYVQLLEQSKVSDLVEKVDTQIAFLRTKE